ncbi:AAA family ATPase [Micromonospora chersina]|uniref:AAA family ATPase n=1 Tax=Micromonospora chersina TaxID=47854 RepID=UPI0037123057
MNEPEQRTSEVCLPFVLPGAAIARENAAGWSRWRTTRHTFTPAPSLSLQEFRRLSPRRRTLHDLHRSATHANLVIQETPMSAAVTRLMWSRIRSNALKHKPTTRAGLMISGGGYQGKTETACEVAAAFEDQWLALHHQLNPDAVPGTRDLLATVAYVQTPVTATPKSVCEAVLDFYGADHRKMTLPQLVHAVRTSLYDHATKVLILDDITRLKMHREADQDALDLVRSLMSMHVTVVLIGVGIPQSGLLREGRHDPRTGAWTFSSTRRGKSYNDEAATQTERRFDLVTLDPFRYDTPQQIAAWVNHLAGIEDQLRLLRAQPGMLTDGPMPEYLFRRTSGIVGLLERLIEDGAAHAIDTGEERLSVDLLDTIDITLANPVGPARTLEETPAVPAKQASSPGRSRGKARNTVFDDRGSPASASATRGMS